MYVKEIFHSACYKRIAVACSKFLVCIVFGSLFSGCLEFLKHQTKQQKERELLPIDNLREKVVNTCSKKTTMSRSGESPLIKEESNMPELTAAGQLKKENNMPELMTSGQYFSIKEVSINRLDRMGEAEAARNRAFPSDREGRNALLAYFLSSYCDSHIVLRARQEEMLQRINNYTKEAFNEFLDTQNFLTGKPLDELNRLDNGARICALDAYIFATNDFSKLYEQVIFNLLLADDDALAALRRRRQRLEQLRRYGLGLAYREESIDNDITDDDMTDKRVRLESKKQEILPELQKLIVSTKETKEMGNRETCMFCEERFKGLPEASSGLLACGHRIHLSCMAEFIAKLSNGTDPFCPDCRDKIKIKIE